MKTPRWKIARNVVTALALIILFSIWLLAIALWAVFGWLWDIFGIMYEMAEGFWEENDRREFNRIEVAKAAKGDDHG